MINKSIFAGVLISISALAYLSVGGVLGAFIFSFGLISIVNYGLFLYTGKAGFLPYNETPQLISILCYNIVGVILCSLVFKYSTPKVIPYAINIVNNRLQTGVLGCGVLSIGCGIIMTTAVRFAKENKFFPLLLGVPVFIVCGFPHCIADVAYYTLHGFTWDVIITWIATIIGNYIGCNIPRWIRV